MLTCFECRTADFTMQVGPCADHDGIDAGIVDERLPGLVRLGNLELCRRTRVRLGRAVDDADNVNAVDLAKAGNVAQASIRAGTDNANTNALNRHSIAPNRKTRHVMVTRSVSEGETA